MAQKNVIKGSAIVPNPTDVTKRVVRAEEWTLTFPDTTTLDVFASQQAIKNSFANKGQITIVQIEEDEPISKNNDTIISIVSTDGIKFEPK